MFEQYNDIVTVDDMCSMLGIGKSKAYQLLKADTVKHVRVGQRYIIPKQSIVNLVEPCYNIRDSQ